MQQDSIKFEHLVSFLSHMNESRTNNCRIDSRELRSNGDTGNTAAIRGNTAIMKKRRTQLSWESVDRLIFLHGLMSQTASSELLLNCTTTDY